MLAEVTALEAQNRYRDAAELLAEAAAVASNDEATVLIARLAWTEALQDHDELALALVGLLRTHAPTDADIAGQHVRLLAKARLFHRAAAALDDLPASVVREPVLRAAAAGLWRTMGLLALAVDAGGGRWLWRSRRWWVTGGPLGFVRRRQLRRDREALGSWPADRPFPVEERGLAALLAQARALAVADRQADAVLDRADKLIDEDELAIAAEVLTEGLAADPGVAVLTKLAYVEELRGRSQAALTRLAEARRREPANLDVVREEAQCLTRLWRFRAALALLTGLSQADRRDPGVRAALAGVYRTMGLPTLARQAYGDRRSLGRYERRERLRGWWRSGGPLRLLLWKPLRFELTVQARWRRNTRYLEVFDTCSWPSGFDPTEVRCRLDWHVQRWEVGIGRLWSIRWWLYRVANVVSVAVAWYVLFRLAVSGPAPRAAGTAVVATLVAFGLYRLVFFRLARPRTWYDVVVRNAPAGLVLLGGGYALTRIGGPHHGWWFFAGSILVAAAGMALCFLVVTGPSTVWWLVTFRKYWRFSPREDILDELLQVLDDLTEASRRNDLVWRAAWALRLENAAVVVERRLPGSFSLTDEATRRWAVTRAKGAAAALRRMKRHLAAPVEGSWDQFAAGLRHEVVALTTGDLGNLRWSAPPSPSTVRRSWWRTAAALFTTLGLAVAPLLAVLAVQPLLRLDEPTLRWAKVVGLGWTVLYLLIAADPKLREKIETAQSVSNLLTTSRRPKPSDGEGAP